MAAARLQKPFKVLTNVISDESRSELEVLKRLRGFHVQLSDKGGSIENMFDDEGLNLLQLAVSKNRKSLIKVFVYAGVFKPLYEGPFVEPVVGVNYSECAPCYSPQKLAERLGLKDMEEELKACSVWEESLRDLQSHQAARTGDAALFQSVFNENPKDLEKRDAKDFQVLHWAAIGGNQDILRIVVNRGISVNDTLTADKQTALHLAAKAGNSALIYPLVKEFKADPDLKDSYDWKAIHMTAMTGDLDCLRECEQSGIEPDLLLYSAACEYKRVEYVRELLNLYCLPINKQNEIGSTGFLEACFSGCLEIVQLFLGDKKTFLDVCTPHIRTKFTRRNAFHFAARHSSVALANLLIESARRSSETLLLDLLNAQAKFYDDGRIYIVRGKDRARLAWHYVEVYRHLLPIFRKNTKGGSVNVSEYGEILKSGWGKDPDKNSIKFIKDIGDERDRDLSDTVMSDMTPLHIALVEKNFAVANLFIKSGMNANVRDVFEGTPLHYACMHGDEDIMQTLLAKGADVNAKNVYGLSPQDVALRNEHTSLVSRLQKDPNSTNVISQEESAAETIIKDVGINPDDSIASTSGYLRSPIPRTSSQLDLPSSALSDANFTRAGPDCSPKNSLVANLDASRRAGDDKLDKSPESPRTTNLSRGSDNEDPEEE